MDGRLVVEDGTILDLLELATSANPWEEASTGRKAIGKGKSRLKKWFRLPNKAGRARKNVAHHYDIGNDLYVSSWMTTCSIAAPILPTPGTASSRPSPTRRRISPPSSRSSLASACSTSAADGAARRSI